MMKKKTLLLLLIIAFCGTRTQANPIKITQKQINTLAASLDRARRAIVEETGLRQNGEKIPAYLERIASPLPGENTTRYRQRLNSYLSALDQAASETRLARLSPILTDTSPENRERWNRLTRSLSYLPTKTAKMRRVWLSTQGTIEKSTTTGQPKTPARDLLETLILIVRTFDDLRDARP
jgi:hypothetical protein